MKRISQIDKTKLIYTLRKRDGSGEFDYKKVGGFSAFWLGTVYAFLPIFLPEFEVHEFVFATFMSITGVAFGFNLKEKISLKKIENGSIE